ncbi:MAG: hypothetical protein IJB02_00365 [Oscillospiraceae bacterium]|nr:hypothetical protein [Oscillospiraceae bacterium]
MKRMLSALLACMMMLSVLGCGNSDATSDSGDNASQARYTVPSPMSTRNYTLDGTPTPEQLRQTAVGAMRDLLSIQWCTDEVIAYYKSGPVSKKRFEHAPENTYGGTLYSNASTGIFQFMEFYDQTTGLFAYPAPAYKLKEALGNSCADSMLWGWSSVCNSIQGGFYPVMMVYKNGYLPVGDYTYNFEISNYNQQPTNKIIEHNGQDKIISCYLQVQPADALVSTPDNHAMMVLDPAHVEYNADGTIDLEKSYIHIQDQRGGDGNGFYDQTIDGNLVRFSGRISYNFTFAKLLEKNYIPVTTAEFTGAKAYDKAALSIDNPNCTTLTDLQNATVTANYPLALIRTTVIAADGTETVLDRKLFGGAAETGVPRSFRLGDIPLIADFAGNEANKPGNQLRIEVIVSTGETFCPITITL